MPNPGPLVAVTWIAPGVDTPGHIAAAVTVGIAVETTLAWRFGWTPLLPAFLFLGAAGTAISFSDGYTRRIPNRIVLPSYPIGAALLIVGSIPDPRWSTPLIHGSLAMTAVAALYLALAVMFPGGLGLGDVRLGGLLGLYLGWLSGPSVITGILTAWVLALASVCVQRIARRSDEAVQMALGPYLCVGALVATLGHVR